MCVLKKRPAAAILGTVFIKNLSDVPQSESFVFYKKYINKIIPVSTALVLIFMAMEKI